MSVRRSGRIERGRESARVRKMEEAREREIHLCAGSKETHVAQIEVTLFAAPPFPPVCLIISGAASKASCIHTHRHTHTHTHTHTHKHAQPHTHTHTT